MVDTTDPKQVEHQEMDVLSVRLLATNPGSPHITSQTNRVRSRLFSCLRPINMLANQNIVMSIDHFRNIYIYIHVVIPWGVLRVGVSTAD